jgi:hypothetical protein
MKCKQLLNTQMTSTTRLNKEILPYAHKKLLTKDLDLVKVFKSLMRFTSRLNNLQKKKTLCTNGSAR